MRVCNKPWWLRLWNRDAPMAFWGTVYLPEGLGERLAGTEELADVLDHEAIHVARQHARGMARWHLRYALSRRFRWREEMAAYHSSLGRLRARGATLDAAARERLAAALAGPKYLFMTTRAEARAFLDGVLDGPRDAPVTGP
jgi:hypothetical protein